jgi:glutathionyl-hydroquinone reductase
MLQGFFTDFTNLHPNRIEVFDLDNFERIEKDSTIELENVLKFLSSQSESLRELRLGIDSHYNERFTVPLLRELKRMQSLKKLRIKFDSITLEQIF